MRPRSRLGRRARARAAQRLGRARLDDGERLRRVGGRLHAAPLDPPRRRRAGADLRRCARGAPQLANQVRRSEPRSRVVAGRRRRARLGALARRGRRRRRRALPRGARAQARRPDVAAPAHGRRVQGRRAPSRATRSRSGTACSRSSRSSRASTRASSCGTSRRCSCRSRVASRGRPASPSSARAWAGSSLARRSRSRSSASPPGTAARTRRSRCPAPRRGSCSCRRRSRSSSWSRGRAARSRPSSARSRSCTRPTRSSCSSRSAAFTLVRAREWRTYAPAARGRARADGARRCSGCGRSSTRRVSHDPGPGERLRGAAALRRPARGARRAPLPARGRGLRPQRRRRRRRARSCCRSRGSRCDAAGRRSRSAGSLAILLLTRGAVALRPLLRRGLALAVAPRRRLRPARCSRSPARSRCSPAAGSSLPARARRRDRRSSASGRATSSTACATAARRAATWIALVGGAIALVAGLIAATATCASTTRSARPRPPASCCRSSSTASGTGARACTARSARALAARSCTACARVVPKGAVVIAPVETSYRIAAQAPVYVVAAPVTHVANTKANDPYGRARDGAALAADRRSARSPGGTGPPGPIRNGRLYRLPQ